MNETIKYYRLQQNGYVTPFLLMLTAIYFAIFTFYISQYSLKLKTLHNLESDYKNKIVMLLKEGEGHGAK
ncbi:Uncharacterised protein [Staphylococcus argenteus]|nr:hypothetical protein SA58113_1491 [Staphylococcus argenteus]SGW47561.1 Uncharacterised protein [Staphylococcus argenteus]SGW55503.1 Uncharacterised protein [Staphylococcus argenteus]SGW72309.1 Uncharacterised protein [Staphylococcus argenteus]SHD93150.1 Uncharacterised protein [Staphylococcus argenteus]